jgi:hypothetical protein
LSSSSFLTFLFCPSISYRIKTAHHRLLIVVFSIVGCRHHHRGVSLLAASLMGWALCHFPFPSLSSPPTQASSACLPISWHVLPSGAGPPPDTSPPSSG